MKRLAEALVVMFVVFFACVSIAGAATNSFYLNGHGVSGVYGDIVISVSSDIDGTVRGMAVDQSNLFVGSAVELVPPGANSYWCVNIVREDTLNNFIFLVKDSLNGNKIVGLDGYSTCASAPIVSDGSFDVLSSGDFTGEVVADTCSSDLAECNEYLSISNTLLNTCQSNLGQCQLDLATFENGCNLPPLTYPYEAQLAGGGDLLSGKLKVTAKKPLIGSVSGTVKYPSGTTTLVVDLVPPHSCVNYWCVKDATGLWFIRDNGTGCDLVSHRLGAGLSCLMDGPTLPYESVSKSDLKGKIRGADKSCPEL